MGGIRGRTTFASQSADADSPAASYWASWGGSRLGAHLGSAWGGVAGPWACWDGMLAQGHLPVKTLAWDTSTAPSAVALLEDDRAVAVDASPTEGRHGEVLLPRTRALLGAAGWDKGAVTLLAVGTGPGSFTGLRVGIATAKGWAVATGVPLVGIPSHAALAGPQLRTAEFAAVVTDAFKGEVYVSVFGRDPVHRHEPLAILPPFNATPERAVSRVAEALREIAVDRGLTGARLSVVGDGLRRYPDAWAPAARTRAQLPDTLGVDMAAEVHDVPCPQTLGQLARARFLRDGADDLHSIGPLYVRGADAKLPDKPLAV